jgi:hypothetical protein
MANGPKKGGTDYGVFTKRGFLNEPEETKIPYRSSKPFKTSGQSLRFDSPTGKLVYGGEGTDVGKDDMGMEPAFPLGSNVKVVKGDLKTNKDGSIADSDVYIVEDKD